MQVSGHIHEHAHVVDGVFIQVSLGVVDEIGGEEESEEEYLSVDLGGLLATPEALGVYDEVLGAVLGLEDLVVEPESLGAGVDGVAHLEDVDLALDQGLVDDVALARPVLAHHHADAQLDARVQRLEELGGVVGDLEALFLFVQVDKGDG